MQVFLPKKMHDWRRELRTAELIERGERIESRFNAWHKKIERSPSVADLIRAYRARRGAA